MSKLRKNIEIVIHTTFLITINLADKIIFDEI